MQNGSHCVPRQKTVSGTQYLNPRMEKLRIAPKGAVWVCFSRSHNPESTRYQPPVLPLSNSLSCPWTKDDTGANNSLITAWGSQRQGMIPPLDTQPRLSKHKGTEHDSGPHTSAMSRSPRTWVTKPETLPYISFTKKTFPSLSGASGIFQMLLCWLYLLLCANSTALAPQSIKMVKTIFRITWLKRMQIPGPSILWAQLN